MDRIKEFMESYNLVFLVEVDINNKKIKQPHCMDY